MKWNKLLKKIEINDILIFFIVCIIFGLALIAFYPGILTGDSVDQINQAITKSYNSWHPILHSFIMGNITKLGGTAVFAAFQIIVFALIWTYCLRKIREFNNKKINKILQIILTIIICITPFNFLYSITLWKDILFSYNFMILALLLYIGLKNKYNYTIFQEILLAVSCVLIMKLRHNGLPIGFLMFCIIIGLKGLYQKKIMPILRMIIMFVIAFIIVSLPEWVLVDKNVEVRKNDVLASTEIYCMGAILNANVEIEKQDLEILNKIYSVEKWKENYSPYSGTAILYDPDYHFTLLDDKEFKKEFTNVFIKYAKKNLNIVLKHFVDVNAIWWSIPKKGYVGFNTDNEYVSELCKEVYNGKYEGVYDTRPLSKFLNTIYTNYIERTMNNKFLYSLIYRPIFALIVVVLIMVVLLINKRNLEYFLITVPMFLNIGTYIILITSQDHRYFYPTYITAYIIIAIFMTEFKKERDL